MIVPSDGFGVPLTLILYFGGIFAASRLFPLFAQDEQTLLLLLVHTHASLTLINFLIARFLNRNGVKHRVGGLRLEYVVLAVGLILLIPLSLMIVGIFAA